MQRRFIVTHLFLHPSLLNREVQHLCDSKGTKCEEHNHCCQGQLAQLGARLHVVSPSLSSDKTLFPSSLSLALSSAFSFHPLIYSPLQLLECFYVCFFNLLLSMNPSLFFTPPSQVPFIPVLFHVALPLRIRTSASNNRLILFFI